MCRFLFVKSAQHAFDFRGTESRKLLSFLQNLLFIFVLAKNVHEGLNGYFHWLLCNLRRFGCACLDRGLTSYVCWSVLLVVLISVTVFVLPSFCHFCGSHCRSCGYCDLNFGLHWLIFKLFVIGTTWIIIVAVIVIFYDISLFASEHCAFDLV